MLPMSGRAGATTLNYAGVMATANRVDDAREELTDVIAHVSSALSRLAEAWRGPAASALAALVEAWTDDAKKWVARLADLSAGMRRHSQAVHQAQAEARRQVAAIDVSGPAAGAIAGAAGSAVAWRLTGAPTGPGAAGADRVEPVRWDDGSAPVDPTTSPAAHQSSSDAADPAASAGSAASGDSGATARGAAPAPAADPTAVVESGGAVPAGPAPASSLPAAGGGESSGAAVEAGGTPWSSGGGGGYSGGGGGGYSGGGGDDYSGGGAGVALGPSDYVPIAPIMDGPVPHIVSADQMAAFGWHDMSQADLDDLNRTLERYGINTPARIKHFLSQCAHESGFGTWREEIASGAAYNGRSDLGNTQPGDGPLFKGSGYIQLTGRSNYQRFADAMNDPNITAGGAAYVAKNYPWSSAGFWWDSNHMNDLIDSGASVEQVTRRVNGGINGLADRQNAFVRAQGVF